MFYITLGSGLLIVTMLSLVIIWQVRSKRKSKLKENEIKIQRMSHEIFSNEDLRQDARISMVDFTFESTVENPYYGTFEPEEI